MIRKGILKAFDSDTYKASIQVIGSLSVWLDNITVSAALNRADMVAGRSVVLLSLDPSNPDDCILVGLWGVPQEPPAPGAHENTHTDGASDEIDSALDPRAYPLPAGTLATRPAAGIDGRFFWTTDEHILYRDNGTSWVKVAVADHADLDGIGASDHHAKTGNDEVYGLLRTGLDASKPAAGTAGRFYWATDTKILYRDTGSAWEESARGETATRLAQLSEKAHSSLTGVGASDHHAKYTDAEAKAAAVDDTAYGVGWNGVTDVAPSKNAVYDEMQQKLENVVEDTTPQLGGDLDCQNNKFTNMLGFLMKTATEVTIATGAITITQMFHTVDTEGDAASDDLDTINGGGTVNMIVIRAANDARTVVVKHNTGNIWLQGKADISLDDLEDGLLLVWDGTKWFDIASGGGGGSGSSTWVGLTDTPGSITANQFVRGNAGGTALEFVDHVGAADPHTGYVLESLFDAQTILSAISDNTPVALAVAEDTLLGRRVGQNIEAISPANIWAFLSAHAAAAVDMNAQQFSNNPVYSGSTVPASPATYQLFLHTPTGRKVLMQYDGTNWIPIISLGTMTVYVDATDGTDSIDKGGAVDSGAFATIQYAVDQVPGLFGGNVIININAETYNETVTIRGKAPTGNFTITLQGTLVSQETATADSMVQGTGATQGTLTDTGAFAGDSYANLLVHVATLDEYRLIDSHTNNVLTIVGCFTGAGAYVWTVYDWGTDIDRIDLGIGQKAVQVYDIKLSGDGSKSANWIWFSDSIWFRCNLDGDGIIASKCRVVTTDCYIRRTSGAVISAFYGAGMTMTRTKVCPAHNTGNGIVLKDMSALSFRKGSIIDGDAGGGNKATRGIQCIHNSKADNFQPAADGYVRIRNCDTGLYAAQGGQILMTANNQYSNNTTDENAVAASFGYID